MIIFRYLEMKKKDKAKGFFWRERGLYVHTFEREQFSRRLKMRFDVVVVKEGGHKSQLTGKLVPSGEGKWMWGRVIIVSATASRPCRTMRWKIGWGKPPGSNR
jgi:hypothetical protein